MICKLLPACGKFKLRFLELCFSVHIWLNLRMWNPWIMDSQLLTSSGSICKNNISQVLICSQFYLYTFTWRIVQNSWLTWKSSPHIFFPENLKVHHSVTWWHTGSLSHCDLLFLTSDAVLLLGCPGGIIFLKVCFTGCLSISSSVSVSPGMCLYISVFHFRIFFLNYLAFFSAPLILAIG